MQLMQLIHILQRYLVNRTKILLLYFATLLIPLYMFKKLFLLLSLFLGVNSFAQISREINPQNCREGESIEYCRQHVLQNELMKDPVFKKQFEKDQEQLRNEGVIFVSKGKGDIPNKGVIYRIPVVFHVVHNGGDENISTAQIKDALFILNRDFARENADADVVYAPFLGMPADVEIEFVFATKAPNGACFSGITRTKNPITFDGASGQDIRSAIISGNDVYNGTWPGNRYLNIMVCDDIGGAAGYTYLPGSQGSSMGNGIYVLQNYVGSFGTGSVSRSRTLTHEVGHWLNLPHTWGSGNSPGPGQNNCNQDDGVSDTPLTAGNTNCNVFSNTCNGDNSFWGFDQLDNVENYMDYSYCSKMFTTGQALRMRTAITSGVGGRNNVISASNLALVGADSNLVVCKADFFSSKTDVCIGAQIDFFDASFHDIQGWNWSFPGGTPSSSTAENPIIVYNTPGIYSVTLVATDGSSNTQTELKTGYVTVRPFGSVLPYTEGFENYTTLSDPNSFWRAKSGSGNAFEVFTGTGSEGNKSIRLQNFNEPEGETDDLVSNGFDLSSFAPTDTVTFSFKYAYRKRGSQNYEVLRFQVSKDCGDVWSTRKTIAGSILSSEVVSSNWTAQPSDFVQVHVTGINQTFFVANLLTRFTFESDDGNNLFLDQINFYSGGPSALNLNEEEILREVRLYPNPSEGEINLKFYTFQESDVNITIQDVTGKELQRNRIKASNGENLVLMGTENLSAGMYFVRINAGSSQETLQFIIK